MSQMSQCQVLKHPDLRLKSRNLGLCSEALCGGYTRHEALRDGAQTSSLLSGETKWRGKCWKNDEKSKKKPTKNPKNQHQKNPKTKQLAMAKLQHPIRPLFHSPVPLTDNASISSKGRTNALLSATARDAAFVMPHPAHWCLPILN